jgi:hypothetical protein
MALPRHLIDRQNVVAVAQPAVSAILDNRDGAILSFK